MLLTYREETKQPLHPITGLPAPWVLSSAGKLIWYLHGSCFLPYHNTVSTPDVSSAANRNTIELIIISDAVYAGCDNAAQQIPTVNCCHVQFMTYWHKFKMIFNGRFVVMSAVDKVYAFFCNADVFLFCFLSAISIFLSSLGSANVHHVHWWALSPLHHEQTRPLLLIGYKFVLVLGPTQFSKVFLKTPPLTYFLALVLL